MDSFDASALPGLYVHIPFCLKKCGYCGFYSIIDRTMIPGFLVALRREATLRKGWASCFDTLYIGGGTPSVLQADELERLILDVRGAIAVTDDAEITVETNPADITPTLMASLRRAGVNRVSLGVQSLDDGMLAFLGRRHDRNRAVAAAAAVLNAGFDGVGLDLLYGIPGQGLDGWRQTLQEAIDLHPDHLSCYQLTIEEDTPLALRRRRGEIEMPGDALQADFFWFTSQFLEENGFVHYEVSNFARPGRESRHNRKYWIHAPYLGLGPAAHSFSGRERRWNRRSVEAYLSDLEAGRDPVEANETLDDDQLGLEALFLGLRTRRGICLASFKARYGRDLLAERREMIDRLVSEGLVDIRAGFLRPTRAGMAVADSLALI